MKKTKKNFKKKPCQFCIEKIGYIDYKNVELLEKKTNLHGKILPSRITGTCARHQRMVSVAIKRARIIGFLPFSNNRIRNH